MRTAPLAKDKIRDLLRQCCDELLAHVRERVSLHAKRWVPAAEVNKALDLNLSPFPKLAEHNNLQLRADIKLTREIRRAWKAAAAAQK